MRDWSEIIQDQKGSLSSAKLAYLLVTAVLCFIAISMEIHGRTDATVLGIVAMMGAGVYGMNKAGETVTGNAEIKAGINPTTGAK